MQRIRLTSTFDLTKTGVTGHYRSAKVPFYDLAKQLIETETEWHKARNQQRNWETITQIISLRTQAFDMSSPQKFEGKWQFSFSVETPDVFLLDGDSLGVLRSDCIGVPMLIGLDEVETFQPILIVAGQDQNIWLNSVNTS